MTDEEDKKYFVLDTNVLLHNRSALETFKNNYVVIPMTVIEELDRFKTHADELGRNARASIRYIDGLREEEEAHAMNEGRPATNLVEGIENSNGGKLIVINELELRGTRVLDSHVPDNRILQAAFSLKEQGNTVILVSKDLNLRIKASVLGIEAQDWMTDKVDADELYTGFTELTVSSKRINDFYTSGTMTIDEISLYPNEFLILTAAENPSQSAIGRASGANSAVLTGRTNDKVFGISGRSAEQRIALQLLLDQDVKMVTLIGTAGTGKTLLALAAGLEMIVHDDSKFKEGKSTTYNYEKMLVTRPIIPMGKDIGFLPGTKDKKMAQWMQPIFDNLSFLIQTRNSKGKHLLGKEVEREVQKLFEDDMVELEALTYIRGRSIAKQYIIVDEAQNLTPHEVKTIISRAGEGTKIVLTGDPDQIDNPYLDASSNGLVYAVERMKKLKLFGHVTLRRAERSDLAAAAAREL